MDLTPITRLTRDLTAATTTLGRAEARYLVDAYYTMQKQRIRAHNQSTALVESNEPHALITWFDEQSEALERQIKRALGAYAKAQPVGPWLLGIKGIGPCIGAGLLAHIDITQAPTVGHIWRFAGLDPTSKWNKGEKRPWNAELKVVCWKAGESFVKVSGDDDAYYGQVYKARKAYEITNNAAGKYADQAATSLAAKRYGKDTEARKHYEAGKLPPARIHLRAERYAVKLMLAHLHHKLYVAEYGREPPLPYPIAMIEGHSHYVPPPG